MDQKEALNFKNKLIESCPNNEEGNLTKKLIQSLPLNRFLGKSQEEIINFIKRLMAERNNNYKNEINNLAPSENSFKFDTFRGTRGDILKNNCESSIEDFSNKLLSGFNIENNTIRGLKLKSSLEIRDQIKNLYSYNNIKLSRQSILLDSRNRNLSMSNYSWNLIPLSASQQGQLNTRGNIHQIIEIRCHPFRLPLPSTDKTSEYYKILNLGIDELSSQAIEIASNDTVSRKSFYNFQFELKFDGSSWASAQNIQIWRPRKIISQLDRISLNFYTCSEPLNFEPDRLFGAVAAGFPAVVVFPSAHYLQTGDLVYMDGKEDSMPCAVLSATSIEIPLNISVGFSSGFYFAKRRILIQLDFICLED